MNTNEIKSVLEEETLKDEIVTSLLYIHKAKKILLKSNEYEYNLFYCELLLMIIIKYSYCKHSLAFKIEKYLSECINRLGYIPMREIAIAKNYFLDSLSFFDPIQKNNNRIFKKVNSMAWDLFHVHFTEKAVLFADISDCDLYFPSILTRDKKLFDMLKDYKINGFAYNTVARKYISFCDIKKLVFPNNSVTLTNKEKKELTKLQKIIMMTKFEVVNKKNNYIEQIKELENTVRELLNVKD